MELSKHRIRRFGHRNGSTDWESYAALDGPAQAVASRLLSPRLRWRVAAACLVTLLLSVVVSSLPTAATTAQQGPQPLEEVPVTATDVEANRANNSPALAAHPNDSQFVVLASRLDVPEFSCTLHLSGDGGRGWVQVQPMPRLPEGVERCYAPEVAFDRGGVLYYLFLGLKGTANVPVGAYLTTSSNRGQSFSPPRLLLGPHSYMVRLAIDQGAGERGRIHLAWVAAGAEPSLGGFQPGVANPIMAAYSDDGGRTFSRPVQVSDPARRRVVAPALAVGPDRRVHVLYYDLQDDVIDYQGLEGARWEGTWSLVLSTSGDEGDSFGPAVVVEDGVVPPERVMLIFTMPPASLTAGNDGALYTAWHDARNGDWDVFVRPSLDGGRSWGGLVRVNDDPPGNGRHQYLPRLSTSPDGRLDAVFYDRRDDPANLFQHVSYSFSNDGGRAFAPNLRLTAEASSSRIGAKYLVPSSAGMVDFGARMALLSRTSVALAAWTDTRNTPGGEGEMQDIFATEVGFGGSEPAPGGSSQGPWGTVGMAGAALGLLGGGMLAWRRRRHRMPRSVNLPEIQRSSP
jgi:hypothetical protein